MERACPIALLPVLVPATATRISRARPGLTHEAYLSEGGLGFRDHAADATCERSRAGSWVASSVTIENSASRQGVVRAIALSDHCRCVSTPRCARASWKVTSTCQ